MISHAPALGKVCHIGFRFVHENLEELHRELRPLKKIFHDFKTCAQQENLQDAFPDIDVIATLFDQLENKIPELIKDCYHDPGGQDFWKKARHDLRANFGAIKSYSELLSEDFEKTASEEFLAHLKKLINRVGKVLPLISKIIPEDSQEAASPEPTRDRLVPQRKAKIPGCILIIDDDSKKRDILRRHLEAAGHTIMESASGQSGLSQVKKHTIDLILLDILMPEMTGHEVLDLLKQDTQTNDIPVLVISSFSELDSVVRCIHAGAVDYLEMPVDPTLLNARVNVCLEKKYAADREKKQSKELERARNVLHAAMESIEDGFAIFNSKECLLMCNTAFAQMYPAVQQLGGEGFTYADFLKKNLDEGRYLSPRRAEDDPALFPTHQPDWVEKALIQFREKTEPEEICLSDGRWIETMSATIPSGGAVAVHKDITDRKLREREIQHRADFDGLTGLANRSYFEKNLKEAFQKAALEEAPFGLMFFDLDGFKKVNDDLGHDFGDLVLTSVADKLKGSLRKTDLVARLGGDEFCALVYNVWDPSILKNASERCLQAIGTFVERDGIRANFGVSIGIAVYPGDANTPEELLSSADAAMYDAKKSGKGMYRFFRDL